MRAPLVALLLLAAAALTAAQPVKNIVAVPQGMGITSVPAAGGAGGGAAEQTASALPLGASAGVSSLPANVAADLAAGATTGGAAGATDIAGVVMRPATPGAVLTDARGVPSASEPCTTGDCMKEAVVVKSVTDVKGEWQRAKLIDRDNLAALDPRLRDETKLGETVYDKNDTTLVQLHKALEEVKVQMVNDRRWINDVHHIMRHYRTKVGAVELGLRNKASEALKIKTMIVQRHRANARLALQDKLKRVTDALARLQTQADTVQGKTSSLEGVKAELRRSIGDISRQLGNLRAGAAR